MSSLKFQPPRPASSRVSPAYPRMLAIGAILLAGCGGIVESRPSGDSGAKPTPTTEPTLEPGGVAPYPFETGVPDTGPVDTGTPDTGSVDTGIPFPDPAGDMPGPYEDASPPEMDGGAAPTPAPTPS